MGYEENNLTELLNNNYNNLFDEMGKEDYILEYDSFVEFRELEFDGKIVGFLTLDTFLHDPECLCLNECYILPEYRGKGILIEIIKELLRDENISFYIRRPNYSFIKFLLKHDLAFEVAPDIVVSHIKFVVKGCEKYSNKNIKKFYRKLNSRSVDFNFFAVGFSMKLCSIFFSDPSGMLAKKQNILTFAVPRKEDLKKHGCRKELNKLTLGRMNEIQYDCAINNDKIDMFNREMSTRLDEKNDDRLVYEKDGEIRVNKNLKPNDMLKIFECVEREIKSGNVSNRSAEVRIEYLLEHPDKMEDTVDLSLFERKEADILTCPFCGDYCQNGDDACKTCGQNVKSLFAKKEKFSFKKAFKNFKELRDKGYVGELLKDEALGRCKRKNYNIDEVEHAQKQIANYEIVKYISQNRIYFNPPSFGYNYHHLKDSFDDERACSEGYLRKISDDEFISRVHDEYTPEQLIQEVEVDGFKFSGKELEEQIYNLKNYTDKWVRDVYEPTSEGIEFIDSSKSMDIFSRYLRGFIYYEFEKYWLENKDKSEREICDGFVEKQYNESNEIELVYYYRNYLWYKYRIYSKDGNTEKAIVKILQLAIHKVNMYHLKNKRNYLLFVDDLGDLLKSIDEKDVSNYYDIAFDEFKLESFKKYKDEIKGYIESFLKGNDAYIH